MMSLYELMPFKYNSRTVHVVQKKICNIPIKKLHNFFIMETQSTVKMGGVDSCLAVLSGTKRSGCEWWRGD